MPCPEDNDSQSPLASRKFLAYLVAELTWKLLAGGVLFWSRKAVENNPTATVVWAILCLIILVAGFIEAGYIVGQAALDKYVRLAQIAASSGHSLQIHGLAMHKPTEDDEEESPSSSKSDPEGTVPPSATSEVKS